MLFCIFLEQQKSLLIVFQLIGFLKCDPVWIRTKDLLLRRQLLYPAELRDQEKKKGMMLNHPLCRGGRIRTYDLLLPKQARYRATLHPEEDFYLQLSLEHYLNVYSI
jgi:hypothetical protein